MSHFADWVSPEMLRRLSWTLLHFIWQGAGLAAMYAVGAAMCRGARARYALAVATMALMAVAAIGTFAWLGGTEFVPAVKTAGEGAMTWAETSTHRATALSGSSTPVVPREVEAQPVGMLLLVEAWFLGVLLLSLRTAGGLMVLERMRRKEIREVGAELYEKCLALQKRMGLERVIRYCECKRLEAPAVMGWFRPVVLLPVRALMGLTEGQIEAVIAHELAHIRRLDSFVNVFQIATETALFYHPAVWWVSQRVRVERENCCDDEAIAICGDAVNYARALTTMEEWRTAPALLMAANRSPMGERVMRMLGWNGRGGSVRMAGLAGSLLCLAGAALAGNALLGVAHAAWNNGQSKQDTASGSVIVVKPETATADSKTSTAATAPRAKKEIAATPEAMPMSASEAMSEATMATPKAETMAFPAPAAKAATWPTPMAMPAFAAKAAPWHTPMAMPALAMPALAPQAQSDGKKESYIDAMEALGFKNLSVDELVGMKIQGVTPDYVRQIRALGLQPTAEELVGMRVQGITPEYVKAMREYAPKAGVEELIGMKVQGVSAEYIKQLRTIYPDLSVESVIGMRVQGVTPEYVKGFHDLGLQPDAEELIGMKVQGVTPEYVKEMRAIGLKPNTDELIGMKVQGVTPTYVKEMQAAGFKDLNCDQLIGAKVQGVTPEFIEKAKKHGFQNLTLEKLIALRNADIL